MDTSDPPIEDLTMVELIERSSLGSPTVMALRGHTPRWVVDLIKVAVLAPSR